jgi:hypothetical protein
MLRVQNKEGIPKAVRKKHQVTYKVKFNRITADPSAEMDPSA